MKQREWYALQRAGDTVEILIYGVIGKDWNGDGVSAQELVEELTALKDVKTINAHISSNGGNVFEGIAIYNTLANHAAALNVFIDSMAASIASLVAMAGGKRNGRISISENGMLMIHEVEGVGLGRAEDMRKLAAAMDKANGQLALTYANKTRKPIAELLNLMAAETWFTAAEALAAGFVDEVTAPMRMAAQFDLSRFHNVPENLKNQNAAVEAPLSAEKALREFAAASLDPPAARGRSTAHVRKEIETLALH